MKKITLSWLTILLLTVGCTRDETDMAAVPENPDMETRGNYNDNYFDWDRVTEIPINNGTGVLSLPWGAGSTQSAGIPIEWLDENSEATDFSRRMYARENGWRLVYSNLNRVSQVDKYFALYNEYTGLFRMFFYSPSEPGSIGTSTVSVGLSLNEPSLLFSFNEPLATGLDTYYRPYPYFMVHPKWTLRPGGGHQGVGYRNEQWYGVEVEMAYDPLMAGSSAKLNYHMHATMNSQLNLTGTTTGNITGDIKGTIVQKGSGTPPISIGSINVNTTSHDKEAVEKIVPGENTDSFFKNLWKKIKGEMAGTSDQSFATPDGLGSAAGSAIVKGAGRLLKSIFGGKKNAQTPQEFELNAKLDLLVSLNSTFTGTSVTEVMIPPGVPSIPLPGSASTDPPLYTESLGAWNLSMTPVLRANLTAGAIYNPNGTFHEGWEWINYTQDGNSIVLNPAVSENFNVRNFNQEFMIAYPNSVSELREPYDTDAAAYYLGKKYYTLHNNTQTRGFFYYQGEHNITVPKPSGDEVIARITFDLEHKTENTVISFSRFFQVKVIDGLRNVRQYVNNGPGTYPTIPVEP